MQVLNYAAYKSAATEVRRLPGVAIFDESLERVEGQPHWLLSASGRILRSPAHADELARWLAYASLPGCFATLHGHAHHVHVWLHLRGEITERLTTLDAEVAAHG